MIGGRANNSTSKQLSHSNRREMRRGSKKERKAQMDRNTEDYPGGVSPKQQSGRCERVTKGPLLSDMFDGNIDWLQNARRHTHGVITHCTSCAPPICHLYVVANWAATPGNTTAGALALNFRCRACTEGQTDWLQVNCKYLLPFCLLLCNEVIDYIYKVNGYLW